MEEGILSDADTDELLGISGIEPLSISSGHSVYRTPEKSPPGSPSDLLTSSPIKRKPSPAKRSGSGEQGASHQSQSSPSRSRNVRKPSPSPKRGVRKFVDSPGKLKIGDLKGTSPKSFKEDSSDSSGVRSSSHERLSLVRRYILSQNDPEVERDKENLNSAENCEAAGKSNSAPATGTKSKVLEVGVHVSGNSLPSSPYRVDKIVVTSHHKRQGPSVSRPDQSGDKVLKQPADPILTYKRKLFHDDEASIEQVLKTKVLSKKGQVLKDKSNRKSASPPKGKVSPPKEAVVHSGSPTQNTHTASKFKVSPRREAETRSQGVQRTGTTSRSLDSSPEKRPSSIMKGGVSVSPGRRPGPVTFRKTNPVSPQRKHVSPPKYNFGKSPTRQTHHRDRFGHNFQDGRSQYSPEKYQQNGYENTPGTSGYYSGKSQYEHEDFSNPLDDVLSQHPLSPFEGDSLLPDSPGMKAAAETVNGAEEYADMPQENYQDVTSFDIEEMEGARSSLRKMLQLSNTQDLHLDLDSGPPNESISTFRSYPEDGYREESQQNDSFEEVASKALLGSQYNELNHEQAVQLTSQLLGREKETHDVPIAQLHMENQVLADTLEREKFRRQHCEKQIGNLQSRLLETQEQLAVAVSAEKKKDIMIEQLDKTLSRVVEGWKKRELEKKDCIDEVKAERDEFETRYHQQKELLEKFEARLQKASTDLDVEQKRCAQMEETKMAELEQHEEERSQWAEALEKEKNHREQAEDERERAREGSEHLQGQVDTLQATLNQERSEWAESEENLRKKLQELEESYRKKIENEKKQVAEKTQLAQETKEELTSTKADLQKMRFDFENAMRERDNLKMELSLLEARTESSKRQLEADLTSEFEKALSEKMNEAHDRLVKTETELREGHRKQIQELNERHSDEMEEQSSSMTEEFKKKQSYLKEQAKTFEERFEEAQEEMRELKSTKHKMELQRDRDEYHDQYAAGTDKTIEMAHRMQDMMQTHCCEALALLNNSSDSPVKSCQPDSVLSHIPSLSDQAKFTTAVLSDHLGLHSNAVDMDEGVKVSPKLPLGGTVDKRPKPLHHDDGVISDVLSTEGEATRPTYTMASTTHAPINGAPVTQVPSFNFSQISQYPVSDYTSLDSYRSSSTCSTCVPSQYPYRSYQQPTVRQPSNTYSSIYEPIRQGYPQTYTNEPIKPQPQQQPMKNNYVYPVIGQSYSNGPIGYVSQAKTFENQPMSVYQPVQHYNQSEYPASVKRPLEELPKDYSNVYNGYSRHSETSAPSMSSGYSSMVNHSSRRSELPKGGGSYGEHSAVEKEDPAEVVSLLNSSNATVTQNDTGISDISARMEQHTQRQQELEHYVRMLLNKEPGKPSVGDPSQTQEVDITRRQTQLQHSPPQKLTRESNQHEHTNDRVDGAIVLSSNPGKLTSKRSESRLVSTTHAPKYCAVTGLAREKLYVKKKQEEKVDPRPKSAVKKSTEGPIRRNSKHTPWR